MSSSPATVRASWWVSGGLFAEMDIHPIDESCPNIDRLTEDSPPLVQADAQGRYPVPVPGQWTEI